MEVKWIKYDKENRSDLDKLEAAPSKDVIVLYESGDIRRWDEDWLIRNKVTHFLILPPSVPA